MINDHPTCQVCRIGGDHDEGEEPPHAGHHPCGDRPGDAIDDFCLFINNFMNPDNEDVNAAKWRKLPNELGK